MGRDQVDVVVRGDGDEHVGAGHTRVALHLHVDGVAREHARAAEPHRARHAIGAVVDDGDLVPFGGELAREARAHPAISDDDDAHHSIFKILRTSATTFFGEIGLAR